MPHPNYANLSLLKPPPTMFPNVSQNVTTTFCNQNENRVAWIGLQERVLSWLHGIHDAAPEPCPASASTSFIRRVSKDRKRHHYSPYPTRCEPPHAPTPSFSRTTKPNVAMECDFPASASEIISPTWHVQENIEHHTTSLVESKVADDLPDPENNPLITFFATDIEEEYCRLILLRNKLEVDRYEADLRWKRDLSHAAMRELFDIDTSIQRVLQSAQYVIDYTCHCKLNVDFQSLFLQYYHHSFQPLSSSPEKPVLQGISYFGESAPQNRSLYIQDVQEQEISRIDCQAFTSLTPDTHNIWVFE